jgi:hypothetical protein
MQDDGMFLIRTPTTTEKGDKTTMDYVTDLFLKQVRGM